MAMIGADVEALRELAREFDRVSNALESSVMVPIRRSLSTAPWRGRNAEEFKALWQRELQPSLKNVATALKGGAETLRKNAAAQERVSGRDAPFAALQSAVGMIGVASLSGRLADPMDPIAKSIEGAGAVIDIGAGAIFAGAVGGGIGRFAPRGLTGGISWARWNKPQLATNGKFIKIDPKNVFQNTRRANLGNYIANPHQKGLWNDATKTIKGLKLAGNILKVGSAVLDFNNQLQHDSNAYPNMSGVEMTARAGGYAAAKAAGGAVGAKVGAAVGAFVGAFGGPVGSIVGGAIGGVVGGWFGSDKAGQLFRSWLK
ncbi:hypothetical protein ABYF32_07530 [Buchananella felis]|uniref:WXG100 family type VII secretion target n=1 Tax=Buchananella felis TaxID=3231492 RepID=UPI00352916CB